MSIKSFLKYFLHESNYLFDFEKNRKKFLKNNEKIEKTYKLTYK